MECGVQTGVQRQIKLLGGVVGQGHAGCGCLCIVDEHINAAEGFDGLVYGCLCDGSVVGTCRDVRLYRKHLHAVETFQLFLGFFQLLDVAAGDDNVGAFLGICGGDAVADGAGLAAFQYCSAAAGDDDGLTG